MNTISLKRIKLLLLADWYELKEYLLWGIVSAVGFFLVTMLFSDFQLNEPELTNALYFMILGTFLLTFNFMNYRINSVKGLGFLTPAKPVEKFISLFIVMFIMIVLGFVVYFIVTGTFSLIRTGVINEVIYQPVILLSEYPLFSLFFLLVLSNIFLLSMLSFKRKYAPLKSLLIIAGIVFVLMKIGFENIFYFMGYRGATINGIGSCYYDGFYPGILSILLFSPYIIGVGLVVLFYVSYLKVKEKEQR